MENEAVKLRFDTNMYRRAELNLSEGITHVRERGTTSEAIMMLSPSSLVETRPVKVRTGTSNVFEPLLSIEEEFLRSVSGKGKCPSIKHVYQRIRQCGYAHRGIAVGIDLVDFPTGNEVCRQKDFYNSVVQLGQYFFDQVPSDIYLQNDLGLTCNYNMITGFGTDCMSAASTSYECRINVQLRTRNFNEHEAISWSQGYSNPQRVFNQKFREVASGSSTKSEDVCSALGLPRSYETEKDIGIIRDYMNTSLNASLTTRFVVLELMRLRILTCGGSIKLNRLPEFKHKMNTIKGIADTIVEARRTRDTVVNGTGLSRDEQIVLARSTCGYRPGDFPNSEGSDLYLGGFYVPSEVLPHASVTCISDSFDGNVEIVVDDKLIYDVMLKYASKMNAHQEMQDARALASCLFMGDGLPNFSLPRPQGYLDIVASALESNTGNALVPPQVINPYALLGGLVLVRQAMLCVADTHAHACVPNNVSLNAKTNLSAPERQHLYHWFKNARFSDAFSIMRVVDPIYLPTSRSIKRSESVVFPTVAWSGVNHNVVLTGSYSQFFFQGEWVGESMLGKLDPTELRTVNSTYYVNGLLDDVRALGARVGGGVVNTRQVSVGNLLDGRVGTSYLDMDYKIKVPAKSRLPFEPVEFSRRSHDDEDSEPVLVSRLELAPEEEESGDDSAQAVHPSGSSTSCIPETPASSRMGDTTETTLSVVIPSIEHIGKGVTPKKVMPKGRGDKRKKSCVTPVPAAPRSWRAEGRPMLRTNSATLSCIDKLTNYLRVGETDIVNSTGSRWRSLVSYLLRGEGRGQGCVVSQYFGISEVPNSKVEIWRKMCRLISKLLIKDSNLVPNNATQMGLGYLKAHAEAAAMFGVSRNVYTFKSLPCGTLQANRSRIATACDRARVCVYIAGSRVSKDEWPIGESGDNLAYDNLVYVASEGCSDSKLVAIMKGDSDWERHDDTIVDDEFESILADACANCLSGGDMASVDEE